MKACLFIRKIVWLREILYQISFLRIAQIAGNPVALTVTDSFLK